MIILIFEIKKFISKYLRLKKTCYLSLQLYWYRGQLKPEADIKAHVANHSKEVSDKTPAQGYH